MLMDWASANGVVSKGLIAANAGLLNHDGEWHEGSGWITLLLKLLPRDPNHDRLRFRRQLVAVIDYLSLRCRKPSSAPPPKPTSAVVAGSGTGVAERVSTRAGIL